MNQRVFDDDQQIILFLIIEGTFREYTIDDEQQVARLQDSTYDDKPELSNPISKFMIRLEKYLTLLRPLKFQRI